MRYDEWEEVSSLPPYNAVRARTHAKTGDMRHALGGTPPGARYKGRRDSKAGVQSDGDYIASRIKTDSIAQR